MKCIICGNDNFTTAADFDSYSVLECNYCKFGIVDPLPSQETLNALYNTSEYFQSHMAYDFNKITEFEIQDLICRSKIMHGPNLKNIPINDSMRMLEIGTGGGFALKGFEEMGFEVEGVETSGVAVRFATQRLNLKIHHASLEEFDTKERFDLVLLNHVLEHFMDLRSVTRKLVSLLAPNGILYVRVPDHHSYDRRVYGREWPAYAHYHISNFSEKSLVLLYQQEGLQVLRTKKFFSERSPLLVKYFLKKIIRMKCFVDLFSGRTIAILGQKK